MDIFVRRFIRASLLWLATGVLMGVLMVFWPRALIYRPAHMHANLLGFVSMMIFGVAYHVLPRFSGQALHSPRMATLHLYFANLGLAGMVLGWICRAHAVPFATWPLRLGSVLAAVGALLFVYNIWRTLPRGARPFARVSGRR